MQLLPDYSHLKVETVGRDANEPGNPIVIACDEANVFPTQVAIASLLVNTEHRDFEIVVLGQSFSENAVAALDSLGKRLGSAITVVHVEESLLPEAFNSRYVGRWAFFKLMAPEILDCRTMLVLDSNVLVQTDVTAIWSEAQPGSIVGGVVDLGAREWKRRLGSNEPDNYINSGVLLIDCEAWRSDDARSKCESWLAGNTESAPLAEQDALSNALTGSTYAIASQWNVTRSELRRQGHGDIEKAFSIESFSGIFFFNGPDPKPWYRWSDPWSQEIYIRYAHLVGLPDPYWVEPRSPREALGVATWAERKGEVIKANRIYRGLIQASMAQRRQANANGQAGPDAPDDGQPAPETVN